MIFTIAQLITGAALVVVVIAFGVALYARHRMLTDDDPRPGYIFDQERN